jgi:hypothetical protein
MRRSWLVLAAPLLLWSFACDDEALAPDDDDTVGGDDDDDDNPDIEYAIPAKEDWVERGVALVAGEPGSWDMRLDGQISPCTVVKKDGTYLLYYVGADGDRSTDGGPRNRALGVASSSDGITFSKHAANPILTHLPQGNEEEGIFSAGATLDDGGDVALLYTAIWAADATTESVQGYLALARSSDGLSFVDEGYVLHWDDPSVWGYGDELIALGVLDAGDSWSAYYIAKGNEASWDLGLASGAGPTAFTSTQPLLTTGDVIGGTDPVPIGPDTIALFTVQGFEDNLIQVRTAPITDPGALSEPVETYTAFEPGYRHTTVFLDRQTETWFMYQATDREEDGDHIVVRTAPAVPAEPTEEYVVGPEEVAGDFVGSRPSIALDLQGQPHIVIDQAWTDVLTIFHKLGGDWQEETFAQGIWGSDRNYLPHMEIDAYDRAWISSWYATVNVEDECGQGIWLLGDMSTAPTEEFHTKIYITWANGNLSIDPQHPDRAVVMARDGGWQQVDTTGAVVDSGQMYLGSTGEKLRFLIAPRAGQDGVWHGVMSGWNEYYSAYRNSLMSDPVTWASYDVYPEQGEDVLHPGLGLDGADPEVAYMAIAYDPGVVVNVWDGQQMVFDPSNLPVIDPSPAEDGNGGDRFGPQWAPALGGGAHLCWSSNDGQVHLTRVDPDGTIGPDLAVTAGSRCAMATGDDGRIHMAYVDGGMRYRVITPP